MSLRLRGATQQNATHSRTAHTRLRHDENKRTGCRSCKDESAVFVVWEEEHKEPKRTTATSCGWSNGACVRRVRRSLGSPPCGSSSIYEMANTVYKCAPTSNLHHKHCLLIKKCAIEIKRKKEPRKQTGAYFIILHQARHRSEL